MALSGEAGRPEAGMNVEPLHSRFQSTRRLTRFCHGVPRDKNANIHPDLYSYPPIPIIRGSTPELAQNNKDAGRYHTYCCRSKKRCHLLRKYCICECTVSILKAGRVESHVVFQGDTPSALSSSPLQIKPKKSPLDYIDSCFPFPQVIRSDSPHTRFPTCSTYSSASRVSALRSATSPKSSIDTFSSFHSDQSRCSSISRANEIVRRLSICSNEEDGSELGELLSTDPNVDITLVLPAIYHLCQSIESPTRKAGYDLIVKTLLFCPDIGSLDWACCYSAVKVFGLDLDATVQESQLKALESLIRFQRGHTRQFRIVNCLMGWIWRGSEVALVEIDALLRIDGIILELIKNNEGELEDFEVEAILQRYCDSFDESMQQRGSGEHHIENSEVALIRRFP
jgi:hypothetical protein